MSDSEISTTMDSSPPDVTLSNGPPMPFPRPMTPRRSRGIFTEPEVKLKAPLRTQLAVTVNIKPNKVINRKRWKMYTYDQQVKHLSRLETFSRKDIPNLQLKKIVYEECPTAKQMHFHALYEGTVLQMKEIINWWDEKVDGNDLNTKIPWRHVDVQEVFCLEGWLEYISKGEDKR